jgi:hypothetical protein
MLGEWSYDDAEDFRYALRAPLGSKHGHVIVDLLGSNK